MINHFFILSIPLSCFSWIRSNVLSTIEGIKIILLIHCNTFSSISSLRIRLDLQANFPYYEMLGTYNINDILIYLVFLVLHITIPAPQDGQRKIPDSTNSH